VSDPRRHVVYDRWSRLRIEQQYGRCVADVDGRQCHRGGPYAGRCHGHAPNVGALIYAKIALDEQVGDLVRAVLFSVAERPALINARRRCRDALARLEALEGQGRVF